jgi:ACS family hexuronate transporter-like MFS transporter
VKPGKIPNLRWRIAGLLTAATALNYLDRQSLPVVITEIQKTIPITDRQYSELQFLFLLAYGIMYAVGGRLMDLLGTRAGYALMLAWWSAANAAHGLVSSALGLGLARFALGLGEGGGFPGSAKAISEWFPSGERSFAFGMFNTGSSIGAVIAPPLIAAIVLWLNWQWVFLITGAIGVVWVLIWTRTYNVPSRHPRITFSELEHLKKNADDQRTATASPISWLRLFGFRQVWGLCAAKFLSDSAWYFFIFWLPKYLADIRHLNIKQIGYYAWIPYAFAGVGSFAGGWLSSYLIRSGWSVDASRKIALGASAAIMPVSLLISASPLSFAIAFFSAAMLGHQFWSTIVQTLAADIFPSASVGTVSGLVGASGSFGAMLFNLVVGVLLTRYHSYAPIFVITGLLHPAGFAAILVMVRRIEPIPANRGSEVRGNTI